MWKRIAQQGPLWFLESPVSRPSRTDILLDVAFVLWVIAAIALIGFLFVLPLL